MQTHLMEKQRNGSRNGKSELRLDGECSLEIPLTPDSLRLMRLVTLLRCLFPISREEWVGWLYQTSSWMEVSQISAASPELTPRIHAILVGIILVFHMYIYAMLSSGAVSPVSSVVNLPKPQRPAA